MNTTTTITAFHPKELSDCIQRGIEAWQQAGELVVAAIDQHNHSLESLAELCANDLVTVDVLAQFERIGRKQVMPRLLASNFPAQKPLQKLPYSEQQRLLDGSVSLLVLRDGLPDTLEVRTRDLTKAQCKQVFSSQGLRGLSSQRAWLEGEREKRVKAPARSVPWRIMSSKVFFDEPCEMTRHDLASILAQIS